MNRCDDLRRVLQVCVSVLAVCSFNACRTVAATPAIGEQKAPASWFASEEREALVQKIRYQELLVGQSFSPRSRGYLEVEVKLVALRERLRELDDQAAGGKAKPPKILTLSRHLESRDALLANIKRTEMMVHQTLVPGCDAHRKAEKKLEYLREILCELDSRTAAER